MKKEPKLCPECGHVFQGNGWDGIDEHWRAKHERIMPYEKAWPMLQSVRYKRPTKPKEDFNQAAFRSVQEVIKRSS